MTRVEPVRLTEYETQPVPELDDEQATLIDGRFQKYLAVERTFAGGWQLRAKAYVGVVVVDDLHIFIEPKVPLQNLFYMLSVAYELPEFRKEAISLESEDNLFEFLVQMFAVQVDQLVRQGLYRSYVDQEEDIPFLRGRILLAEQLRRNIVHQRFVQRTNNFTPDMLENHILQFTLWQLARQRYINRSLIPHLRRTLGAFAEIPLHHISPAACDTILYTRMNQRYQPAVQLAKLLLQHLSLSASEGEHTFFAYLFEMPALFERFITRFLQKELSVQPLLRVKAQLPLPLDEEGREIGYPDIVIYKNGQPRLLLDCKYKPFKTQPKPADRNQMFLYARRLGVETAVLLYPVPARYAAHYPGVRLEAQGWGLDGSLVEFKSACRVQADRLCRTALAAGRISYEGFLTEKQPAPVPV